jgi:hypothetical protein
MRLETIRFPQAFKEIAEAMMWCFAFAHEIDQYSKPAVSLHAGAHFVQVKAKVMAKEWEQNKTATEITEPWSRASTAIQLFFLGVLGALSGSMW